MNNKASPRIWNFLWFLAGCLFMAAYFKPQISKISGSEGFVAAANPNTNAQLAGKGDARNARFVRATTLYDADQINTDQVDTETPVWSIPVRGKPVLLVNKNKNNSYYDPQTGILRPQDKPPQRHSGN